MINGKMIAYIIMVLALVIATPTYAENCKSYATQLEHIEQTYNLGYLEEAKKSALTALACAEITTLQKVQLHLKLSTIYDRIGLHQNTRPVAESFDHVETAAKLAAGLSPVDRARVSLVQAEYYYRAEMAERQFTEAERHGQIALVAFTEAKDIVGQADAVHTLGLIYFQRREMEKARIWFNRSLVLERGSGAPRPVMLADYGRHVGFIYLLSGNRTAAIPYFEQSFADRVRGGLKDPAMFAAITLASTLTDLGRLDEASVPLEYALKAAEEMASPGGMVRAQLVAGKFHSAQNNQQKSIKAYEKAYEIALKIGLSSSAKRAQENLEKLKANAPESE